MLRVFLLVTALIVYGSLYPWDFHAAQQAGTPLVILLHSWPDRLDRFLLMDIPINVMLYVPFGASGFLAFSRWRRARWALPVLLAAVLSASMEMLQLFDDHRVCSGLDLAMNVTGACLGALCSSLWLRTGRSVAFRAEATGPAMLLCCWLAAMLFPFMPDMSRTHLRVKWAMFTGEPFAWPGFLASAAEWAVAGRLLQVASGRKGWSPLYVLLFVLLPARFLIVHTEPHSASFAGAIAGGVLWLVLSHYRSRDRVLLALVIASIVVTGLAPFYWSAKAQPFLWMPFVAMFRGEWERAFGTLLHKLFVYGSAVWLAVRIGMRWWQSALFVAALLLMLELAQLHMPAHIAEITDPLLAVLMALILSRADQKR